MKTKEYRKIQLDRIKKNDVYGVNVKFMDAETGETNWMSLTNEEFELLKNLLTK